MNQINRREFLRAAGAALASTAFVPCASRGGKSHDKPNIIFILADDMGWMDTPLYGSTYYETPNLRRLAERGMLLTDAYAASPLCSPTRASIMTGKYPARLRITTPACHLPPLDPDKPMLAERAAPHQPVVTPQSRRYLPLAEYTIGEALRDGGYHTALIGKWHLGLQEKHWPRHQGFDHDLGAPNPGPPSYFSPYRIKTIPDGPKGQYITDRMTDEAIAYLDAPKDRPFALFLWHFAVHAPFQAKDAITQRYREKTDARGRQRCAVMASMLQSLDEGVGRVLDKVDELGVAENTIIVFTSDNGGNMYDEVEGEPPTNNAPLRGGKGTIWEGGVREPCIVVWPGVVRPGSRSSQIVSSVDFYPTLLDMAGIPLKENLPIDGVSIIPLLKGQKTLEREAVFCHFPHYTPAPGGLPSTSVRKAQWKLIRFYGAGPEQSDVHELYDLSVDLGETQNVAGRFPAKVKELALLIDGFLDRTDALVPIKNPAYQAAQSGWHPSKDCRLRVENGMLNLISTGGDPFIQCADMPMVSGYMAIRFRMRSDLAGPGYFFWTDTRAKGFSGDRRIHFDVATGGTWHEYEIPFRSQGVLKGLRIDPGISAGTAEFERICLMRKFGVCLKSWEFGGSS